MSRRQPKQGYLKVADIATFASLAASIIALVLVLENNLFIAGMLLIVAAVCDGLDGRIARAMNQASEFGMYLDSLVDIVSFGMVPAAIGLALSNTVPVVLGAIIFVAAGAYRLARFQVTKLKGQFQGMPITVNGFLFGIYLLFGAPRTILALPVLFVLSAVLMASTFRVKKL